MTIEEEPPKVIIIGEYQPSFYLWVILEEFRDNKTNEVIVSSSPGNSGKKNEIIDMLCNVLNACNEYEEKERPIIIDKHGNKIRTLRTKIEIKGVLRND